MATACGVAVAWMAVWGPLAWPRIGLWLASGPARERPRLGCFAPAAGIWTSTAMGCGTAVVWMAVWDPLGCPRIGPWLGIGPARARPRLGCFALVADRKSTRL